MRGVNPEAWWIEEAMRELDKYGPAARPELSKLLAKNPPLEVRRRIETLLKKLDAPMPPSQVRFALRSITVLERIGTLQAQELLMTIPYAVPNDGVIAEAEAALRRMTDAGR